MFFGSYCHTFDEKNRLVIPSKFRNELGEVAYILKGYDGALSIFKEEDFKKLIDKINSLPFNEKNSRDFIRIQMASASQLEIKSGRALIPGLLLNKYKIGKEVIVIGAGDHIEVWDAKAYEQYESNVEDNFEEIAENLTKKEN